MKRIGIVLLSLIFLLIPFQSVLAAEEPGFSIQLNRDWGYGGFGGQIQGNFSIIVKDDLDFVKVTYMMDDVEMGIQTEAPFRFRFSTDDYAPGDHTYWAIGELSDGTIVQSNRISAIVLSAEDANVDVGLIMGIIFGTMAVGGLISWVVTNIVSKKTRQGEYFDENHIPKGFTFRGGTICPKCGEPYAYHVFSANLLTHKFDRCPHCGKYAVTRPISRESIMEKMKEKYGEEPAQKLEQPLTEEQKLRKQLDESRYLE
ncbi:MAG: hypothetical protein V2J07_11620 [Anaerolineae bacterium]|jgi:hypothetical protein|nr:hypothetical protein [Anaerolineae bacterium]